MTPQEGGSPLLDYPVGNSSPIVPRLQNVVSFGRRGRKNGWCDRKIIE